MKFKCKKCGSSRLEEIISSVIQSTEVIGVGEGCGSLDYGTPSYDGGVVDYYQCFECGEPVLDNEGFVIDCADELAEYLKHNNLR